MFFDLFSKTQKLCRYLFMRHFVSIHNRNIKIQKPTAIDSRLFQTNMYMLCMQYHAHTWLYFWSYWRSKTEAYSRDWRGATAHPLLMNRCLLFWGYKTTCGPFNDFKGPGAQCVLIESGLLLKLRTTFRSLQKKFGNPCCRMSPLLKRWCPYLCSRLSWGPFLLVFVYQAWIMYRTEFVQQICNIQQYGLDVINIYLEIQYTIHRSIVTSNYIISLFCQNVQRE